MGWVIREGSFPWNALDEEGAYRAYATDERRSRSRPSTEKGPAKRLTHFSDGLLGLAAHACEQNQILNSSALCGKTRSLQHLNIRYLCPFYLSQTSPSANYSSSTSEAQHSTKTSTS
ncbi:MAG: hypothetical protein KTR25_20115 [Myxococcales bacterium]|nr:hypothetical protein [Myxococcales bacterium]